MPGINIGVDLGTSNVRFFVEGKGLALTENSVTASDIRSGRPIAIGSKAYRMIGRTSERVQIHYPLRHGVVSDFTACQDILRYYLQIICGNRIFKPNLVISMPSTLTGLEQRTLLNIAASSGAAKTCLMEKALACAIGAGVDYRKPRGAMVVDIGGGTTEIAVVTMGCLAQHESLQIAGNTFDEDIRRYVRRERDILIGRLTAEEIKQKIGCAYLRDAEIAIAVKGKSYLTGMPVLFEVNTTQYFCQNGYMSHIADALGQSLALIVAPLSHSLFGQWYWYQGVDIVKIACQLHLASHVSSKVFADVWPIAIFQLIDNLSQFGMWLKEE